MPAAFEFQQAPGHLIRRAHQIATAVFADEAAAHGITAVQFAILNVLMTEPGIDQVTLAGHVVFDVATIGSVIARLERKGWLRRGTDVQDRRRKLLWLTPEGEQVVLMLKSGVEAVQHRILEPLAPEERTQLVALLAKLVTNRAHNQAA